MKQDTEDTTTTETTEPTAMKPKVKKARAKPKAKALKSGTIIERTYKGKSFTLKVLEDGFKCNGETYPSLTAAAKAVTKYPNISGPIFWLGAPATKK